MNQTLHITTYYRCKINGGRTFIELSKAIDVSLDSVKGEYTKNLFISHGLFTKGKKVVEQHFDNIYAYNDLFKK